jgi:Protein of unknown function (DUF1573)
LACRYLAGLVDPNQVSYDWAQTELENRMRTPFRELRSVHGSATGSHGQVEGLSTRRRSGTSGVFLLAAVLLSTALCAGCEKDQAKPGEIQETLRNRPAPGSPPPEDAPPEQTPSARNTIPHAPRIRFDQTHHDFGEVEAGEEVEHTFTFRNVGDDVLAVKKVLTSCGCTGAIVSDGEVPPGGTGAVEAVFHTKGFQGNVKKSLTVESNDPENELVRLTIGGKVIPEVSVEPRYVNWGNLEPVNPPRPVELRIRFIGGRRLRLEKIQSESPSVVLTRESEAENEVIYTVALAGNLPRGTVIGRITIQTNSEKVPEVHVPFHGSVQGHVKMVPNLLSLGRIAPGQEETRNLSLAKTGGPNFTVRKVETTTDEIRTEIIEERKGSRYRIKVSYKPAGKTEGKIAERITIFLSDGEESFLEVPLYGKVGEEADKTAQ